MGNDVGVYKTENGKLRRLLSRKVTYERFCPLFIVNLSNSIINLKINDKDS